mgnify:FL=1
MYTEIEGELKELFASVPKERKDGLSKYEFKEGDRVFMPKVQYRSRGFSSQHVTEYLLSEYKDVKVVKDITKATVILGYKWTEGDTMHQTWGDDGVHIESYWRNETFKNCLMNNVPYTLKGVTYNNAQTIAVYIQPTDWNSRCWEYYSNILKAGIIVSHHKMLTELADIQKHIATSNIVLISDIKSTLTKVNRFQNKNRQPFTEEIREKVLYAKQFDKNNETDLEILAMALSTCNLSEEQEFFTEVYYSASTWEFKRMIRKFFVKDEVMNDVLSCWRRWQHSFDEAGIVVQLAKKAKYYDIPLNWDRIISSYH